MEILNVQTNLERGVINDNLLINSVLHQCSNSDVKRLLIEDGVQLEVVSVLRLDFLKIIKIEHLWMLKSLTTLTIAHNKINKIENLDELVNLKQLDLSFNNIAKIENVNTLKNIEILMLNNNDIEKIENMESLVKLTVFSISGNLIDDFNEFRYLRQFHCLKSLSLRENPCCNDSDNDFIKAILPQLMYLNYIMISPSEKEISTIKYRYLIQELNEMDELAERNEEYKRMNDCIAELNYKSFVEQLDGPELFEGMFEQDKDGYILLNVKNELETAYDLYKNMYLKLMKSFVEFGCIQYNVREHEISSFQNVINEARKKCMNNGRQEIEKYLMDKKLNKKCEPKAASNVLITDLWKKLMTDEVTLHERSMETLDAFEENLKILVQNMIDQSQNVFKTWKEHEQEWINSEKTFFTKIINGEIEIEIPEIKYLTSDQDILMDIITLSYENHIQFINDREELLIARINKWLYDKLHEIKWDELNRNRAKVLDLANFRDKEKIYWENN